MFETPAISLGADLSKTLTDVLAKTNDTLTSSRRPIDQMLDGARTKQGDDLPWLQCIINTGGTCNLFGCHTERGPTNCEWFNFGYHCMCQPGFCSNLLGRCERTPNQLIEANVVLENVHWPGWFIEMGDNSWNMWVQRKVNLNSKWNLLQTPHGDLMLGSFKFPSYVATTISYQSCSECTDTRGNRVSCNCQTNYQPQAHRVKKQGLRNFVRFEKAHWPGAFKMYSVQHPFRYWYATKLGSYVLADWGEPGPQGWWIMKNASSLENITPPA